MESLDKIWWVIPVFLISRNLSTRAYVRLVWFFYTRTCCLFRIVKNTPHPCWDGRQRAAWRPPGDTACSKSIPACTACSRSPLRWVICSCKCDVWHANTIFFSFPSWFSNLALKISALMRIFTAEVRNSCLKMLTIASRPQLALRP